MQDTYFCTLRLGGAAGGSTPSLPALADLICAWLNEPRRGYKTTNTETLLASMEVELAPSVRAKSLRVASEGLDLFGLRLDHPDSEDPGLFWRTDIVAALSIEPGSACTVSVRVGLGSTEDSLAPIRIQYGRPRIVPQLIKSFGATEVVPLGLEPHALHPDGVRDFVQLLTSVDRSLPVVFISARNWDDKPICDPAGIADSVAGLAHVFVAATRFTSFRLNEVLEPRLSAWDGGVRVYWPGFVGSDNPFRHPLWIADRIRQLEERPPGFKVHLLERLARSSIHRFAPGVSRWADLERAHTQAQMAELRKAGNPSDMLQLFETENERLEAENRDLKVRLARVEQESERWRNMATAWRESYEESQRSAGGAPSGDGAEKPIETPEDAYHRIQEEFPEQLVFTGTNELDPTFDNPDKLYLALRWLATTYRDARIGTTPCTDFDVSCREASGFWYRGHQSKVTMGKYEEEYYVNWRSKKTPLREHIGSGSSKSARSTIRVAFFFDSESKAVVVGYLGQHQTTDAT